MNLQLPISLENADLYLELQRNLTFLSIAQSLTGTGCFGWSAASGEVYWSEQTYNIFEHDRAPNLTLEMVLRRIHPDDRGRVQEALIRASETKADFHLEYRWLMPDGLIKHLYVAARALTTASGNLEFLGAAIDVSAAKEAEEKRRQDEDELRRITDVIPQLIIVYSPEGWPIYLNQRTLEYMGLSLEEVQAESFRDRVIHPDDVERFRIIRQNGLPKGVPFETEQRVLGRDGKYRWFLSRYNPLKDEQGRIIRWYATATDIDDRKVAEQRLQNENVALREEVDRSSMFEEIVGESTALSTVLARVTKVAPTDSTVLITGETGTGKELIARAIHKRSRRAQRAFVSVNCAALAPSLISSELFGHEKGAFTGATQRRIGRFELANGGTLFLDEVGELPLDTQIALLRVLQERELERVGGKERIKIDVRIVTATNRDLNVAQANGTFRSDLFYRLNVFPVHVPPLRERPEDIVMLLEYFLHRYAHQARKVFKSIDKHTLEFFKAYDWPGNVRELQNIVERSVILSPDDVFCVDNSWLPSIPCSKRIPQTRDDVSDDDSEHERKMIESALTQSRGRISGPRGAATVLGLPSSTLNSRIQKLKIRKSLFKLG
ncbi:sigma-54-dependent Fis family transcriptional regulator [Acidicapsa acidisoli]|uniref:sigma-54-dependent Fis family transcriptional regulator n=1 Tax=Acidicapsa acidisoli TaxID=1615681 RepID=UPI0021DFA939|nr:sigma-54-dependent Fis family transcriptional regulator [Acidicapsa acidisoli]